MRVIGIDPGPRESAYVLWTGDVIIQSGNVENGLLLSEFRHRVQADFCAIEQIRGFGVPAGNDLFDCCWWSGRFFEAWGPGAFMLPRKTVLDHLGYGGAGNKDAAVRAALISRFGDPGKKASPGVMYGVTGHLLAAMAVAVCFHDRQTQIAQKAG